MKSLIHIILLVTLAILPIKKIWTKPPGYFYPWGKDNQLAMPDYNTSPPSISNTGPLHVVMEKCIFFHQAIITPADGPRSHFRPTSSRYMLLSIRRYGVLIGFFRGCDRLLRENNDPWVYRTCVIDGQRYKWDPVEPKHKTTQLPSSSLCSPF